MDRNEIIAQITQVALGSDLPQYAVGRNAVLTVAGVRVE